MKHEYFTVPLSIAALVVSIISLKSSCEAHDYAREAQDYTRVVEFEQRRQEVIQILLQNQVLLQQFDDAVRAALKEEPVPEHREWEEWADIMHELEAIRAGLEKSRGFVDQIPAGSTAARVHIERARTQVMEIQSRLEGQLELVAKLRETFKEPD